MVTWAAAPPLLKVLLFFACAIGIGTLLSQLTVLPQLLPVAYRGVASALEATIILIVLTLAFVGLSRRAAKHTGILPDWRSPLRLLGGLAIGLLLFAAYCAVVAGIADVHWTWNSAVGGHLIILALVGTVIGSGAEEIVDRGYPLRKLMEAYGHWPAQIIVAVLFIAYHFFNGFAAAAPLQTIVTVGLGSLLFGLAAVATSGLAAPTGVHGAWNFGYWAIGTRGLPAPFVMGPGESPNLALAHWIAFLLVVPVGIYFYWRMYVRRTRARVS